MRIEMKMIKEIKHKRKDETTDLVILISPRRQRKEERTNKFSLHAVSSIRESELPLVGNPAPDFEAEAVFDQEFIKVKLSEYIGKKYVILFFYPLDFTFVCPTGVFHSEQLA
ncbi:hypothetical protein ERO13_D12G022150v2 [Gossypium hirsutum]|nr:hypothetical protein ERO13_D12G022150v2 [Gossypium hirsutum]